MLRSTKAGRRAAGHSRAATDPAFNSPHGRSARRCPARRPATAGCRGREAVGEVEVGDFGMWADDAVLVEGVRLVVAGPGIDDPQLLEGGDARGECRPDRPPRTASGRARAAGRRDPRPARGSGAVMKWRPSGRTQNPIGSITRGHPSRRPGSPARTPSVPRARTGTSIPAIAATLPAQGPAALTTTSAALARPSPSWICADRFRPRLVNPMTSAEISGHLGRSPWRERRRSSP